MTSTNETSQSRSYKYTGIKIEDKDESTFVLKKSNYTQEYLSTAISTFGMFLVGIHFTWIAPILPNLLSGTFKIHITMEQSVWVISLVQIGAIPGSILASLISNHYGRKKTIVLISIPYVVSSIISIFAENVWHYYLARFLAGLSVGGTFSVIPMYVSEISSPEVRGLLSTSVHMSSKFAVILIYISGAYLPIVKYEIFCAIFPILMLVFSLFLPESPYYYVVKQDLESAEKSLKFLRKKSNVRKELNRLIEGYQEETAREKQSFCDLFKFDYNRKSLVIIFVLLMAQQLAGGTAFLSYIQVIFKDGNSSIAVESCGIFVAIINFSTVVLSGGLIDRLGRRKLLYISCYSQLLPLSALAIYFYLQNVAKVEYIEYLRLTPLIALVVFKFAYAIGISPIPYLLLGELFPTSVKAQAGSFITICGSLLGVAANKMYQTSLTEFGYPPTFGMFIVFDILAIIFIYFMVPETKGLTLEEIQINLRKCQISG
ncbi:facilitated trehalose transporter Tret1-2 homolog [Chrysoperla carnea]|uniref:facilitated trehalose transporter Tret1-2 homolog n=1 Tax=Chrysoperla carnea TaxID=189513 RepID=UPI001D05C981|nr:facilitated trehalose transporter Tret1-2 homolog [Chrysoperla carnea]